MSLRSNKAQRESVCRVARIVLSCLVSESVKFFISGRVVLQSFFPVSKSSTTWEIRLILPSMLLLLVCNCCSCALTASRSLGHAGGGEASSHVQSSREAARQALQKAPLSFWVQEQAKGERFD